MHDALAISDILCSVFKFTDTETDVGCVRVCKAWHEPALDALWYRVNKLEQLLKLLGPMGEMSPGLQTFLQYHISSERWERFSFYANRVRRLECTKTYSTIHHQSFAIISISRPMLNLLPNLTHLTWNTEPARPTVSLTLCLLFLTPSLKSLVVRTGVSPSQGDLFAIANFFRDVALRSPRLEHIEFRSDISFHDMGPVVSNFLTSLPRLRKVKLSDSLLSSDVVTALAKCSDLETVTITKPGSDATSSEQESADLENFMPFLEEGAFPSINTMGFKAHLWNATHFLQSAFPASRLVILEVRTVRYESHEDIASFFVAVATACPTIESLSLDVCREVEAWVNEPVPFAALEPLLQCRLLRIFVLLGPWPLDLNDAQVATLASHWPRMQALELNAVPCPSRHSGRIRLTFMALSSFAMHCPHLQSLAICVQPIFIPSLKIFPYLPKLEILAVSITDGDFNSEELALFLAEVLPTTCVIVGKALADQGTYAQYTRSQSGIETTLLLLPTLRKLQRQYREKLRVLEEEVQRLNLRAVNRDLITFH